MNEESLSCLYFSATGTTQKCVETIAATIGKPVKNVINFADNKRDESLSFNKDDVVLVGAPAYGGRVPSLFAEKIQNIHGNGAKTIAVVVYGNRDYDDALLEMADILKDKGFRVVAAGTFIGQHSIFPIVGMSRPDKSDIDKLSEFGELCIKQLARADEPNLSLKGNRPYKEYNGVPIHPAGDRTKCKVCGVCSKCCPVSAIDPTAPWTTDKKKCISCGRCIVSCPSGVRQYSGIKYNLIGKVFTAAYSKRKEPEFFI